MSLLFLLVHIAAKKCPSLDLPNSLSVAVIREEKYGSIIKNRTTVYTVIQNWVAENNLGEGATDLEIEYNNQLNGMLEGVEESKEPKQVIIEFINGALVDFMAGGVYLIALVSTLGDFFVPFKNYQQRRKNAWIT